jgi:hypothetical protein
MAKKVGDNWRGVDLGWIHTGEEVVQDFVYFWDS